MKTLVRDITHIQTGLYAKPSDTGELVYLQVKHFDEFGHLLSDLYPDLPLDGISEKHILNEGDVLFAAKGGKNFAYVFENHNEPSVASTSFFVIRLTDNNVLPSYLAWFLNNHNTQIRLKGQAMGTSIPSISKQVIENLELNVPSIETQKTILQIVELFEREKSLIYEIESLREKLIQQMIINSLKL